MAGISVLMILGGLSCSAAAGQGDAVPPWKLSWADNFNGPVGSGPSPKYWEYNTGQGSFGTNEVETMTSSPQNVDLDGHGNLVITALGHGAAGSPGTAWTSGRVETRADRLFGAPNGGEMMVTASIKQPDVAHGLGYWPGFWMLGRTAWPETGEIDILENVDGYSKDLRHPALRQPDPAQSGWHLRALPRDQRLRQRPADLHGLPHVVPHLLHDRPPRDAGTRRSAGTWTGTSSRA